MAEVPADPPSIAEAWAALKATLEELGIYDEFNDFCGEIWRQLQAAREARTADADNQSR
jgi:hypothetical protein